MSFYNQYFPKPILTLLIFAFVSCSQDEKLPVAKYYEYDKDLPLLDSVRLVTDTTDYSLFYFTYRSVHDKKVTGKCLTVKV